MTSCFFFGNFKNVVTNANMKVLTFPRLYYAGSIHLNEQLTLAWPQV